MKDAGIRVLGALRRDDSLKMPERHLGLVPVAENEGERQAIEAMGTAVAKSLDIEAILHLACLAPELEVVMPERKMQPRRCRIGIARDEAFSFYYTASSLSSRTAAPSLCRSARSTTRSCRKSTVSSSAAASPRCSPRSSRPMRRCDAPSARLPRRACQSTRSAAATCTCCSLSRTSRAENTRCAAPCPAGPR